MDETLAQLLVVEGFSDLEEVAFVELSEIANIEGFDDELGAELQTRAKEALERKEQAAAEERKELGVSDELASIEMLNEQMLLVLGKSDIKTLDDLGVCQEYTNFQLTMHRTDGAFSRPPYSMMQNRCIPIAAQA